MKRKAIQRLAYYDEDGIKPKYGRGYSRSNLFSMIHMAKVFPDLKIVQTLSGQLSWSQLKPIKRSRERLAVRENPSD